MLGICPRQARRRAQHSCRESEGNWVRRVLSPGLAALRLGVENLGLPGADVLSSLWPVKAPGTS